MYLGESPPVQQAGGALGDALEAAALSIEGGLSMGSVRGPSIHESGSTGCASVALVRERKHAAQSGLCACTSVLSDE
jgi:hypothetical protein